MQNLHLFHPKGQTLLTSENKKRKENIKRILNIVLSLFLSIIFLYFAFRNSDLSTVFKYVSHPSYFWIFIFIFLTLFAHYLRALRWKVMLHSVKPDVSIKNLFGALMIGYGVNCVLSRVGEISRAVLVGKWEGLSRSSMLGTVIIERVIDLIFFGLTIVISLWMSTEIFKNFPWLKLTLYISFVVLAGGILFLYMTIKFKEKFYKIIIRILSRFSPGIAGRTAHIFEMLTEGFASLKGTKNYIQTIFLSIAIMLLYAITAYVGFLTIGMEHIKPVTFEMGWIVMAISSIGVAIPTPGGTGSYHILAKSTLVQLFKFTEEVSLAYAFLTHIINYFLSILFAVVMFLVLNKQHLKLNKIVKTDLED